MDPLLAKNLITTKDASELSGYTSDYLARLVRGGEIAGKKIGHSWLIDSSSLDVFLGKQKNHKLNRSRELANSRVKEYRTHNEPLHRIANDLTTKFNVVSKIESL
ncbi:MAG: helix-turn-helix domain-containing protein, partial [Candidatus Kaiserbacteria bacterium]|nr:helix-turn-helix domain-containing protein [Candidatus Kaiserbacteria bacterium]